MCIRKVRVAGVISKKIYDEKEKKEKEIYEVIKIQSANESNAKIPSAVNRVQAIHTHGAANDLLDKMKTAYVTELFSKSDVRRSIEEKIPLSVATPGDSRYNSVGMGEPKYIFFILIQKKFLILEYQKLIKIKLMKIDIK